jgi:BASS family bile acid:Na+ symporter
MIFVRIAVLVLQLSIVLLVFSLGLETSLAQVTSLIHRPWLLVRSLLSMNFFMPLLAFTMAFAFHLTPEVKVALVFLAVSPVPPVLPRQQLKLGGKFDYVGSLLAIAAVLSILIVPLTIELLGKIFGRDIHIGPLAVAKVMGKTVLLPLATGMFIRKLTPKLAQRAAAPLSGIASSLLVAAAVVLVVMVLPEILHLVGNGTILSIVVFVLVGAAIGHWLGGPDPTERSTLALATASRHPGLAIAIAGANFPDQRRTIAAAILLYFLVKMVVLIPYNLWCKRRLGQNDKARVLNPRQKAA